MPSDVVNSVLLVREAKKVAVGLSRSRASPPGRVRSEKTRQRMGERTGPPEDHVTAGRAHDGIAIRLVDNDAKDQAQVARMRMFSTVCLIHICALEEFRVRRDGAQTPPAFLPEG